MVLGVVRILQPASGYDIRRELLSWNLGEWVHVKPGSVYSALATLERDGLVSGVAEQARSRRPERVLYSITGEGEQQLEQLLRLAWWKVRQPAEPLLPALSLMEFMARGELVAAVEARVAQLEAQITELTFFRASIRDGATGADGSVPEHVREICDFLTHRITGELDWARQFARRLGRGDYAFAGERGASADPPLRDGQT